MIPAELNEVEVELKAARFERLRNMTEVQRIYADLMGLRIQNTQQTKPLR